MTKSIENKFLTGIVRYDAAYRLKYIQILMLYSVSTHSQIHVDHWPVSFKVVSLVWLPSANQQIKKNKGKSGVFQT